MRVDSPERFWTLEKRMDVAARMAEAIYSSCKKARSGKCEICDIAYYQMLLLTMRDSFLEDNKDKFERWLDAEQH